MKTKLSVITFFLATLFTLTSCLHEVSVDFFSEDYPKAANGVQMSLFQHLDSEVQNKLLDLRAGSLPLRVELLQFTPPGMMLPTGEIEMNITAIGSFTYILQVRLSDLINTGTVAEGTIQGNGTSGSTTLRIPAFNSHENDVRVLLFEYFDIRTYEWEWVEIFQQPSTYLNIGFTSNMDDPVPYEDKIYTIFKTGTYPEVSPQMVFFRVITASQTVIVDNLVLTNPNTVTLDFFLPKNEEPNDRMIYLQYSIDYTHWVTFDEALQLADGGGTGVIHITYAYFTPNDAKPEGSVVTVALAGDFTEVQIRAKTSTKEVIGVVTRGVISQDILNHGHPHDGTGQLQIPDIGLNGWDLKSVYDLAAEGETTGYLWDVEYFDGQDWIRITLQGEIRSVVKQYAYYCKITNPNPSTYRAAKTNGAWPLKLKGLWRENEVMLQVRDAAGYLASNSYIIANPGNHNSSEVNYNIPLHNNTSSTSKTLYLWYYIDGKDWQRWDKGVIPCQNWVGESTIIQQ